jgi:hypothetical protein
MKSKDEHAKIPVMEDKNRQDLNGLAGFEQYALVIF